MAALYRTCAYLFFPSSTSSSSSSSSLYDYTTAEEDKHLQNVSLAFHSLGTSPITTHALIRPCNKYNFATCDCIVSSSAKKAQNLAKSQSISNHIAPYEAWFEKLAFLHSNKAENEKMKKMEMETETETKERMTETGRNKRECVCVYLGVRSESHAKFIKQIYDTIPDKVHILCEKPLCLTMKESIELHNLAKERGSVLMEAYHYRFHPLMNALSLLMCTIRKQQLSERRDGQCSTTELQALMEANERRANELMKILDRQLTEVEKTQLGLTSTGTSVDLDLGDLKEMKVEACNFSPSAWWRNTHVPTTDDISKLNNLFCYCVDLSRFCFESLGSSGERSDDFADEDGTEEVLDFKVEVKSVRMASAKMSSTLRYTGAKEEASSVEVNLIARKEQLGLPKFQLSLRFEKGEIAVSNFNFPFLYNTLEVKYDDAAKRNRSLSFYGKTKGSTFDYQLERFFMLVRDAEAEKGAATRSETSCLSDGRFMCDGLNSAKNASLLTKMIHHYNQEKQVNRITLVDEN